MMAGKQQYTDQQLDILKEVLLANPNFTIRQVAQELARPEHWGMEVAANKIDRILRNDRSIVRFGAETAEAFRNNLRKASEAQRGSAPKQEPLNLERFSSLARSLQISK